MWGRGGKGKGKGKGLILVVVGYHLYLTSGRYSQVPGVFKTGETFQKEDGCGEEGLGWSLWWGSFSLVDYGR